MMDDLQIPPLREPTVYQIRIQGILDESWGDYFGGKVTTSEDKTVTTLCTPLIDQPALIGLVNRLNGLGLRLLSVEQMPIEGKNIKENY